MENIGAPPGGWDSEYTKVKHVDWKHGEQMTLEMWESLQPRVLIHLTGDEPPWLIQFPRVVMDVQFPFHQSTHNNRGVHFANALHELKQELPNISVLLLHMP